MIETYRGVVYPHQLDHMGHMNVQWYVAKFDEGTWHLFASVGITPQYIRDNKRGMAALEQVTQYKSEALAGDLLVVRSEILAVRNKTLRFRHIMTNAVTGIEVAATELLAVHLDREARKSCPLPEDIRARCSKLLRKGV